VIGKQWRLVFHFPLPLTVVAIVTIAAALSPHISILRLLITYLLIFFGLVLAAYALDALSSDWSHLIKDINPDYLRLMGLVGLLGFIGTATWQIMAVSYYLIIPAISILTFVVCYNVEKPRWFHNKWGFSVSWGGLIASGSYYYQTLSLNWIMIPLFLIGFLIAMQEYYSTNTHSSMQQAIGKIDRSMPERRLLRKESFKVTSLMCYSWFTLAMTLLAWRLL
jgi:hypothetical protein